MNFPEFALSLMKDRTTDAKFKELDASLKVLLRDRSSVSDNQLALGQLKCRCKLLCVLVVK